MKCHAKLDRIAAFFASAIVVVTLLPMIGCKRQQEPNKSSAVLAPGGHNVSESKVTKWAYRFAVLIYDLPGFESKEQVNTARAKYEQYRKEFEEEYAEEYALAEPFTGLKVALFKPMAQSNPWVLAFAGSESLADWIGNVNSGAGQAEVVEQIEVFKQILKEQFKRHQTTASGVLPELVITGHSLGGGLAQAAAYQLDKDARNAGMNLKIHLVTWNAFGAIELIRDKLDKGVTEEQLRTKNERLGLVAHYFVCDDVVSQLGEHWQGTLRRVVDGSCHDPGIRLTNSNVFATLRGIRRILAAHSKGTFEKAVNNDLARLQSFPVAAQPDRVTLKGGLSKVALILKEVAPRVSRNLHFCLLRHWLQHAEFSEASSGFDQGFLAHVGKTVNYAITVYTKNNKLGEAERANILSKDIEEAAQRVRSKPHWTITPQRLDRLRCLK